MSTYCEPEHQRLLVAWQQAMMIPSANPDMWRKDHAGRVIKWLDYEDPQSQFAWTISSMSDLAKKRLRRGPTYEAVHVHSVEKKNLRAC